jgi:diacylglycerol kinase (ATP)
MRVTAIYNPEAGQKPLTRQRLAALLDRAGYHATLVSAKGDRWKDALEDPGDLVVVAGGDGTTAKVAKRLAGRGVPLAILPAGTANNVARSFGLDGSLDQLIARWSDATSTPVDLGLARGPWGEELFIESCGLGVFPRMLEIAAAREKLTVAQRARFEPSEEGTDLMIELVRSSPTQPWAVAVDGSDLSGDYIMLEAMNIAYIGGGIGLAPRADASDGTFDVIAVREPDRDSFIEYLREREHGATLRRGFALRARQVVIGCAETLSHIDDEPWPERDAEERRKQPVPPPMSLTITVQPGAIEVLL